ncbi:MAG: hypothetical protein LBE80_02555 [Deltaproteobacteria bacterium]|jgi:AICAR transformylase/IMP cyclohydrolase PurH|nr:hypothetical protein [Deltaproteobacteria bacterium]
MTEWKKNQGQIGEKFCRALALKVFLKTSAYDKAIGQYLSQRLN